ncbi:MAG: FUSC family protein, partial [Gluconacetobacter sp.]
IVFVVILTEMARQAHHPHALVVPVMTGGIAAACLISVRAVGAPAAPLPPPLPGIGLRAKLRRWGRSCRSLSACQFPLRLSVLMALIVALLCRRPLEPVPIRASQRALGAALGVLLSCLFLFHAPSGGAFILFLAGLGIASMVARKHNYMLYSMVATPLIMVLVGGGKPIGEAILVDRLVSTIVGAALLVAVNVVVAKMMKIL